MSDFSDFVNDLNLKSSKELDDLPESPGFYLLFDENANFIYVGKAESLESRVRDHFQPSEDNILIKVFAKYFARKETDNVGEAEKMESHVFDEWVKTAGQKPLANRDKPPQSEIDESIYKFLSSEWLE